MLAGWRLLFDIIDQQVAVAFAKVAMKFLIVDELRVEDFDGQREIQQAVLQAVVCGKMRADYRPASADVAGALFRLLQVSIWRSMASSSARPLSAARLSVSSKLADNLLWAQA